MGVRITESAMCIALGYVYGRFTVAICLILTSASPRSPPPSSARSLKMTFFVIIYDYTQDNLKEYNYMYVFE